MSCQLLLTVLLEQAPANRNSEGLNSKEVTCVPDIFIV
jgi:hypothetical protein